MKEATGELNMTVITIVAIAAIAAFFYAFVWPGLQKSIARNQCAAEWGIDTSEASSIGVVESVDANNKKCMECTHPTDSSKKMGCN